MDIVHYHIFINLLVNHIKNNFIEYREFVLIFAIVRTAILFRYLFLFHTKKNFFDQKYNRGLFSKMENTKYKSKKLLTN